MDYANQRRLKIWTQVTITEAGEDPALVKMLEMPDYQARIERAELLKVQAFDWNCPQHITPRYTANEFEQMTGSGPWFEAYLFETSGAANDPKWASSRF
jgi:hypothetical protein